ncbi:hypothetical protein [Elizabethkingia anophelis]|uniref:hypothetical protein n=1 Tax=Elizabethkingia anophelis TaxID=1117645 RepID=UPI0038912915
MKGTKAEYSIQHVTSDEYIQEANACVNKNIQDNSIVEQPQNRTDKQGYNSAYHKTDIADFPIMILSEYFSEISRHL